MSIHPPKHERNVTGVEYHHADLLALNEVESLLSDREFDYVVNLGGYIDHTLFKQGGRQLIEEHFVAVQNLLAVLSRERLQAYIHIGSSDEYGNAPALKHENERISDLTILPWQSCCYTLPTNVAQYRKFSSNHSAIVSDLRSRTKQSSLPATNHQRLS